MQKICPIEDHYSAPVIMICANPKCEKTRFLCISCVSSTHNTCNSYLLHIDSILKKDFLLNQNWIQDKDLRQVISFIEKNKPANGFNHLIDVAKVQLERDCESLIKSFIEKVNKAKEQYLSKIREYVDKSNINLDEFLSSFRNTYNFDSLIALLQQKADGTESQRLADFFKKCALDEEQNAYLQQKAKDFYFGIQKYISEITNRQPFKRFQEAIPYRLIEFSPKWSWDPFKKSVALSLTENNMLVKKTNGGNGDHAVLGNLEFKEGCHKWGIEILELTNNQWICFGLIESHLSNNLEEFLYKTSIGLTTSNQINNMTGNSRLENYRNKIILFDLDLDEGTFQISCDNIVLAKEQNNLKNKTFLPFIDLLVEEISARLHVYDVL